jgi:hypothetical protein
MIHPQSSDSPSAQPGREERQPRNAVIIAMAQGADEPMGIALLQSHLDELDHILANDRRSDLALKQSNDEGCIQLTRINPTLPLSPDHRPG